MEHYEYKDSIYVCGSWEELKDVSLVEEYLEKQGYDLSALEFVEHDRATGIHFNAEFAAIFHRIN